VKNIQQAQNRQNVRGALKVIMHSQPCGILFSSVRLVSEVSKTEKPTPRNNLCDFMRKLAREAELRKPIRGPDQARMEGKGKTPAAAAAKLYPRTLELVVEEPTLPGPDEEHELRTPRLAPEVASNEQQLTGSATKTATWADIVRMSSK
jgi:hypothetical protein